MDQLVDFFLNFSESFRYVLIFLILLGCGIGVPIPEDIILFVAGILAYYGASDIGWMILICYVGVMIGDSIVFYLGSHFGRKITKKWIFAKLLPPDRLALVSEKLRTKGNKLIFAARFMPGLRAPIFFTAGTLHLPYKIFFFYDGLAALLSVPAITYAVYYFGDEVDRVIKVVKKLEHGILFVILAFILIMVGKWYFNHRRLQRVAPEE